MAGRPRIYEEVDKEMKLEELVRTVSVTSQFSGISVIQFSPIKTQKKQPKLQFYDI